MLGDPGIKSDQDNKNEVERAFVAPEFGDKKEIAAPWHDRNSYARESAGHGLHAMWVYCMGVCVLVG